MVIGVVGRCVLEGTGILVVGTSRRHEGELSLQEGAREMICHVCRLSRAIKAVKDLAISLSFSVSALTFVLS